MTHRVTFTIQRAWKADRAMAVELEIPDER
jgi:hypothetical protein